MCATILMDPDVEQRLQSFLAAAALPRKHHARSLEILAHAWSTVGGGLQVGDRSVRLLGRSRPARTAATLHVDLHGEGPVLEVARVALEQLGMTAAAWAAWCDERPELVEHGFDRTAKYPQVRLTGLGDKAVLRLALGLRDLWLAVATTGA